jgi:4-amino-4-deoxy-L-arabinose transferase-like glycosyltransferase
MKCDVGLRLFLVSCVVSVLLRGPYFQHPFTFIDEAWWAVGARELLDGGHLYRDVWLDKQPPIFWFCALLFRIAGVRMDAIHIGSLLAVLAVCFVLYRIGERFFGRAVGGAAAVMYALASTMFYTPRIIGMNTETLMVVFTSGAVYFVLAGLTEARARACFAAGVLAAAATLTKPVAATELAMLFGVLAVTRRPGARWKAPAWFAAGASLALIVFLGYLVERGILRHWWDQSIVYGFSYVGQVTQGAFLKKLVTAPASFVLIYAWLWLLVWKARAVRQDSAVAHRVAAWWIVSAFAGVALGRRFYANYFIQVIPPLALLGAAGAVALWRNRGVLSERRFARVALTAFACSFLWFHSRTFAHAYYLIAPGAHGNGWAWKMCLENRKVADVARYLQARTSPKERIFVWGSKAELYILSGRKMATPFMDFDVGADVPMGASGAPACISMANKLRLVRPRYVVDVQQTARIEQYPGFPELLQRDYYLEAEFEEVKLYRSRDDPSDPEIPSAPI